MATNRTKSREKQINAALEQTLFNDVERFEFWFAARWKRIAVLAVLAAVAVAAVFGVLSYRRGVERKAAAAFADAANVEELTAALAKYTGHRGEALARFRLAGLYIEAKQNDKALEQLRVIAAAPETDLSLRGQSQLLAAYLLEQSGKLADAAAEFRQITAVESYSPALRCEAGFAAGRLLIALKRFEEAGAVLRNASALATRGNTGEYWKAQAAELLLALDSGECKAAPTNPAVQVPAKPAAQPAAKAPAKPAAQPAAKAPAKAPAKPAAKPAAKK